MKRDVYISEHVDAQRVREYAKDKALEGDRVIIHLHSYDKSCLFQGHELEDGSDEAK